MRIGRKCLNFRGGSFNIHSSQSADQENKLMKQIAARILTSGPITVAEYMREVLTNPLAGYYINNSGEREIFGQRGDFITSPEISSIFGEVIRFDVLAAADSILGHLLLINSVDCSLVNH